MVLKHAMYKDNNCYIITYKNGFCEYLWMTPRSQSFVARQIVASQAWTVPILKNKLYKNIMNVNLNIFKYKTFPSDVTRSAK
jgi:hypothetical protein